MNYPAASSGVSTKDGVVFIVASDGVLDPMLRNKRRDGRSYFGEITNPTVTFR